MAEKTNNKKKSGGLFDSKKMTRQEWKQASLKRNQMAILNNKTSFVVREAYKIARTNIIFSCSGSGTDECRIIAVTSASPGEGKTTSTLNLSLSFAQTGSRVLLIDGDLRKPRIHQYLGVVKSNGLSTILSNQKTFDEVVYHDVKYGLDCLTAGSIPPNPAELLASEAMKELLENLKYRYDYIFIDTPPVTVVTDAAALSKYVNGLIVVVRDGYTDHSSIEHALHLLKIADANVLGFFLNDVDPANSNYGTYNKSYGKRYGYKYGFRYGTKTFGRYEHSRYNLYDGYGYGYGYSYEDRVKEKNSVPTDGFNKVHNKVEEESIMNEEVSEYEVNSVSDTINNEFDSNAETDYGKKE